MNKIQQNLKNANKNKIDVGDIHYMSTQERGATLAGYIMRDKIKAETAKKVHCKAQRKRYANQRARRNGRD